MSVHWSIADSAWLTNPDGSSGYEVLDTTAERLAYCQQWFPGTTSVSAATTAGEMLAAGATWPCSRSWSGSRPCSNSLSTYTSNGDTWGFCQAGNNNCGYNGASKTAYMCLGSAPPPPLPPPPSPPVGQSLCTSTPNCIGAIASWQGKVSIHWSITDAAWLTNPDGTSGAEVIDTAAERLAYCQQWFPGTTSVSGPTTAGALLAPGAIWPCSRGWSTTGSITGCSNSIGTGVGSYDSWGFCQANNANCGFAGASKTAYLCIGAAPPPPPPPSPPPPVGQSLCTSTPNCIGAIASWQGMVSIHWSITDAAWLTNPDGTSGAEVIDTAAERLAYCQQWFPGTTSVSGPTTAGALLAPGAIWPCSRGWSSDGTLGSCTNAFSTTSSSGGTWGFCQAGNNNCGISGVNKVAYLCIGTAPSPPPLVAGECTTTAGCVGAIASTAGKVCAFPFCFPPCDTLHPALSHLIHSLLIVCTRNAGCRSLVYC